jgi:hypothetical protein
MCSTFGKIVLRAREISRRVNVIYTCVFFLSSLLMWNKNTFLFNHDLNVMADHEGHITNVSLLDTTKLPSQTMTDIMALSPLFLTCHDRYSPETEPIVKRDWI